MIGELRATAKDQRLHGYYKIKKSYLIPLLSDQSPSNANTTTKK